MKVCNYRGRCGEPATEQITEYIGNGKWRDSDVCEDCLLWHLEIEFEDKMLGFGWE